MATITQLSPGEKGSRVPPHSVDAEELVLACGLTSSDALAKIRGSGLRASDFYKPAHQFTFDAMVHLADNGEPVDTVTVADTLQAGDVLEDVGGIEFLLELQKGTPATSRAAHYAGMVLAKAEARRLVGLAAEIAQAGYDERPAEDVVELLTAARRRLTGGCSGRPLLVSAADVTPERVSWAIVGVVPIGEVSIAFGPPKNLKSTLAIEWAARLTRGKAPGDLQGRRTGVVILSTEDDAARVIVPRLAVARADLKRVTLRNPESSRIPRPADLEDITAAGARFVILDNGGDLLRSHDAGDEQEVRDAIAQWRDFAREHEVAVLMIRHSRKTIMGAAADNLIGSRAWSGVARSLIAVGRHEDRDTGTSTVIVEASGNLGVATTTAYRVEARTFQGEGWVTDVPALVERGGPPPATVLETWTGGPTESHASALDEAKAWLQETLQAGPMAAATMPQEAKNAGHSWATVRRAKDHLGIKPEKTTLGWIWALPEGQA